MAAAHLATAHDIADVASDRIGAQSGPASRSAWHGGLFRAEKDCRNARPSGWAVDGDMIKSRRQRWVDEA